MYCKVLKHERKYKMVRERSVFLKKEFFDMIHFVHNGCFY